jgi:DNA-binding protein YbaB
MFDKLSQIGGKGAALTKMALLQRKISKHKVVVEENGVRVVVTGDGKLKSLEIDGVERDDVVNTINDAIAKAQKYAADNMQGSLADLGKLFG